MSANAVAPGPLYPQLRPHPKGPSREQVASHQRARIYGAMIEAVAAHGYRGTSVARVIALAGVSRRAFYEQFANKQECFLATHEIAVARAMKHVNAAYRIEHDWLARMQGAFDAFAREVANEPGAARLALVEALGVGPQALERVERATGAFEQIIGSSFERSPRGVRLPPALLRGIVGGVARVTRTRLMDGRAQELPALAGELQAWVLAYDSPAVARLATPPCATPAARPRPGSPMGAGEDARTRMLRVAGTLAARGGYDSLTAGRIASGAGVSNETFNGCFHSAEECFLVACELAGARALAAMDEGSRRARDWPEAVLGGIAAVLRLTASDPVLARLLFVEIFAAGLVTVAPRIGLIERSTALLRAREPASERMGEIAAEAVAGGIYEIVRTHVVRDKARLLPAFAEHSAYFALAPAIGAEAAVEQILAARRPTRASS